MPGKARRIGRVADCVDAREEPGVSHFAAAPATPKRSMMAPRRALLHLYALCAAARAQWGLKEALQRHAEEHDAAHAQDNKDAAPPKLRGGAVGGGAVMTDTDNDLTVQALESLVGEPTTER